MRIQMLAAACLVALVPALAQAKTIRVPKDHAKIQDAIDAAADGDTIVVSNGTYAEDVVVSGRNDLRIRAQVNGRVKVEPVTTGVRIDASNDISVTGFAVISGEDGFYVNASNDVTITRFSVSSVTGEGVEVVGSNRVHVTFGKITGCGGDGVAFADNDELFPVDRCDVKDVVVEDCDNDGIDVLGSNVLVLRCRVSDPGDNGFEADDRGAGPVTFRNCRAIRADGEGFSLGAPNCKAISCKAEFSDDDGFDVEGDGAVLRLCTATRSESNGYNLDVDGATLFRCSAVRSSETGFDLSGAANSRIEKCLATRSGEDGFFLDVDAAGNTLVKNTASKSGEFGLDDESAGDNTFIKNKFGTVEQN